MRLGSITSALLLCASLSLGLTREVSGQSVGNWGDPERIVIEGAKFWNADEVRAVLVADIDAVVAGHPSAQLADYPKVLADRLREGYLKGGFAHVKVTSRLDPDAKKIVITIDEGPQFTAGEIEVRDAKQLDAAAVATWLTSKQPDASARVAAFDKVAEKFLPRWVDKNGKTADLNEPAWKSGKPVSFTKDERPVRNAAVRRALDAQGFHRAEFNAYLLRDEAAHTVRLVVLIENEGEPSKVDRIEVAGSERDTQDDVVKFLGIQPGQIVTESIRSAWLYKLWMSGRYFEHDVSLTKSRVATEPTVLQIKLVDYKKAPPLRNPFTPEEELVLKCREWVLSAQDRGDAFIVSANVLGMHVEFTTVKNDGTLCLIEPLPPAADHTTDVAARPKPAISGPMLFAGKPGEILYVYAGGTQLLRSPMSKSQIIVSFAMEPDVRPKNEEAEANKEVKEKKEEKQKFHFMLGAGFKTKHDAVDLPLVSVTLGLSPTAMLGLIHQEDKKISVADGVMTIKGDDSTYRIDQATGRLLEFSMQGEEKTSKEVSIKVEPRSFAECLAAAERRLEPGSLEKPNAYQASRPVSSCVQFLLESPICDWVLGAEPDAEAREEGLAERRIVRRLIAADLLRPLEEWWAQPDKKSEQDFSIPLALDSAQPNPELDALMLGLGRIVAGLAIKGAEQTFPRDSWPWTLTRGASLFIMQKTQFAGGDLTKLYNSEDLGPVGRLVAALLLEKISGEMAAKFAESGIDKLSVAGFTADYAPFMDREKYGGQVLLKAAEMLREFTDEEAQDLDHLVLGKDSKLFVVAVRYLREHKAEPIEQSLSGMLNHVWANGLSELVGEQLKQVYNRNLKLVREKEKKIL